MDHDTARSATKPQRSQQSTVTTSFGSMCVFFIFVLFLRVQSGAGDPEFDTNRRKFLIRIGQLFGIATTAASAGCRCAGRSRWMGRQGTLSPR